MKIEISTEKPPVYDELQRKFGVDWDKGLLIACFPRIHTKNGERDCDEEMQAHELVHLERQQEIGVEEWWRRYVGDVEFRMLEEIAAYIHQLEYVRQNYKHDLARVRINSIVRDFTTMYGFDVSPFKARELLYITKPK